MPLKALGGGPAIVSVLLALYGLAALISAFAAWRRREGMQWLGLALLAAAFALNTVIIGARWAEGGRPPFKTLYETLIFYPWCVAVVTLVLIGIHRLFILIPFAGAVSVMGLAYGLYKPDVDIINLPPALQSGWFVPHVVTYFVAYGALFASFALALIALCYPWFREKYGDKDKPALDFENYAHQATLFGVAALTLGLVMGAVWGKVAWGDYWTWDPKENWALISWLAYMIYLHLRYKGEYRGRTAMWVLIIAFGAVIFTYLGMNLLPASQESLHVYQ